LRRSVNEKARGIGNKRDGFTRRMAPCRTEEKLRSILRARRTEEIAAAIFHRLDNGGDATFMRVPCEQIVWADSGDDIVAREIFARNALQKDAAYIDGDSIAGAGF
jgi:hypothetical protein